VGAGAVVGGAVILRSRQGSAGDGDGWKGIGRGGASVGAMRECGVGGLLADVPKSLRVVSRKRHGVSFL
jgi:hypothetical protein